MLAHFILTLVAIAGLWLGGFDFLENFCAALEVPQKKIKKAKVKINLWQPRVR